MGAIMNMQLYNSNGLDPNNLHPKLFERVMAIAQKEQAQIEQANKAPLKKREFNLVSGSTIDLIKAAYKIDDVLRNLGYIQVSRNKWIHPKSTSGNPGIIINDTGRYYSFHGCDSLNDGHTHDVVDILVAHMFNGKLNEAIKHFSEELDPQGNKGRRLDYVKAQGVQGIATPALGSKDTLQLKFGSLVRPKPHFIDGNSLSSAMPSINWLVRGLIESSSTGMWFGAPGAGKSFIALDLACCTATGLPFNGRPTKKGSVWYFTGEGHGAFARRIRAWLKKHGYPDLSLLHVSIQTINLESDMYSVLDEINNTITNEELSPVLVIVDTMSRHLQGDENSSKDTMKFISIIDSLRDNFVGCTAIIIHHTGNSVETAHRARGSSSALGAMDFACSINTGVMHFTKTKDSELPKDIEFKLEIIEIGIDEDTGEKITSCVPEYGEKSENYKKEAFTKSETAAIRALIEVAVKEKRLINEKYVCNTEAWREQLYTIRKAEEVDVKQEALKKGFQNVIKGLIVKHALVQVSTDSILVSEEHQDQINTAINIVNISLSYNRETGTPGNFPTSFPAV
jgi:hypothetical protein